MNTTTAIEKIKALRVDLLKNMENQDGASSVCMSLDDLVSDLGAIKELEDEGADMQSEFEQHNVMNHGDLGL